MTDCNDTERYNGALSSVTMNKPLSPWGHTRFHKALAIHIHHATRLAGHGDEHPNYGMLDEESSAKGWDIPRVERE